MVLGLVWRSISSTVVADAASIRVVAHLPHSALLNRAHVDRGLYNR